MVRTRIALLALAGLALLALAEAGQGQQPAAVSRPVYLVIRLPADAVLEIEGSRTLQTGEMRTFQSPPLPVGKTYIYTLKATWTEDGKTVTRTREVHVTPGKEEVVDLRQEAAAKPEPKPKPAPKPEPKAEPKPAPKPEPKPEPKPAPKPEAKPAPRPETQPKEAVRPKPEAAPKLLVPYVPTPQEVVDKMLELAEVKQGDVVYDLGCGDGRIVVTAAKKFGAKGVGVDLDPKRVAESKENVAKAGVGNQVEIRQGDVLKTDVSPASVVTLYLLPEVNLKLRPILQQTLKPGSRIVSHDFDMGDWKPLKTVEITDKDGVDHTIYLWKVEARK